MTDPQLSERTEGTWPPAITRLNPALPTPAHRKASWAGRASLWVSSAGVACWLITVAVLSLLANFLLNILKLDTWVLDTWIHAAYFTGLACEMAGIGLGTLGRAVKAGRIGVFLSLGILCLMVFFTLAAHQVTGGWIWDPDEGQYSNCGCDDSL